MEFDTDRCVTNSDVGQDVQQLSGGCQRLLVDLQDTAEHELRVVGSFEGERTVQTILGGRPHMLERNLLKHIHRQ